MEGCRLARPDDVGQLADLASAAVAELAGGRGGAMWARREARSLPPTESLAGAVADPDQQVVVGTIDDTVMGYGIARVEGLRDDGLLGVVSDLYTDPGAREIGLGELMMDALLEWCRGRGCFGVDSLALPGDRATKNFFESYGLVARAIIVHRPLS